MTETTKIEHLRKALSDLVSAIDFGVTPEVFKQCEREKPAYSSLRYAREVLRFTEEIDHAAT